MFGYPLIIIIIEFIIKFERNYMMIIKIKTSDYHNQIIQVILDLGDYGF
jgi:hypothetical protein